MSSGYGASAYAPRVQNMERNRLMTKPILCLDFDGVLHSYTSGWQGAAVIPDPPVPGAIDFLYEAIQHFDVCIYSSRSHQEGGIDAMVEWLSIHDKLWRAQQKPAPNLLLWAYVRFPDVKPAAFVTIDDRAITFTGVWPPMALLLAFKPWNKHS